MRLSLVDLRGVEQLEIFDVVLLSAFEEIHQARDLIFFGRDDQLADALIRNSALIAIAP